MNFDVIDKKHRKKVSSDTGLFSFGTWGRPSKVLKLELLMDVPEFQLQR